MHKIPLFSLETQHTILKDEINTALNRVFNSKNFILGQEVSVFESEIADFIGTKYAISCASGTDAIHLSLRGLGIKPGDEVITSAFSFIASASAIIHAGATPVFADIDPQTFTLDPASVKRLISAKTRALLAIHLYGHPADMKTLSALCQSHGIYLLEDTAQAFGSRYHGQFTGSLSDAGCHSFYPTKNLGAYGDGGLITTNNHVLGERIKLLRNHCDMGNQQHINIGFNSRLDAIQAAILRVKLKYVDRFNAQRRCIADIYNSSLETTVITPKAKENCEHVYHLYTIRSKKRDAIQDRLIKNGIDCRVYYSTPLPKQAALKKYCKHENYPQTMLAAAETLSIPMFPELSVDDARTVAQIILDV